MKERKFLRSFALLVATVLTITSAFSNYSFVKATENDVSTGVESTDDTENVEEDIWKLVWNDEFDGDSLDLTKWNNEGATGRNGWGNQELQDYQMEYSEVKDGKFIIKPQFQWNMATKKLVDNSVYSTRVWTKGLYSVKYGKIEFRAKMPKGQGTWANAWMLGNEYNWPQCGEIDVASTVNTNIDIVNIGLHIFPKNVRPYATPCNEA